MHGLLTDRPEAWVLEAGGQSGHRLRLGWEEGSGVVSMRHRVTLETPDKSKDRPPGTGVKTTDM